MAYPSTFLDLQNTVIANLRLDATADLQKVKDAINQVYTQVIVETDANVTYSTAPLTAATATYVLPVQILRMLTVYATPVAGVASRPLRRLTLDQIIQYRSTNAGPSASTGTVWAYCLQGLSQLEVYPTPQTVDTLTFYYIAMPTALAADTDVPVVQEPYATDCLSYGAMAKLSEFTGDPDGQYYRQLYQAATNQFRAHLNRRTGRITGQFGLQDNTAWPSHDPSVDRW